MSTHKHIDRICVAVLVCTVLITVLFMNGSRLGIETVKDGDAAGSTDSAWFTKNDRDGDWNAVTATKITLSGDHAAISGSGAYLYDGDVVIAQAGSYVVSGTLDDGSIRVSADNSSKVWLLLNGADITCSDDAALRVEQADKVFLTLAAGTENRLASGAAYSEAALADNTGGAVFSHDDLTVNGSGSLTVTAAYKHGFDVNDELVITGGEILVEAPGDGLHVNEGLRLENASLTVKAGDEGVNVQGAEAALYIASGSVRIESVGAGLKSASGILIEGGTFSLQSEGDGIHSAGSVTITDGDFTIRAGDDGVHADQAFAIEGGRLLLSECYEGIEALTIDIGGGDIEIYPRDDGLNANGGSGGFGGMFQRPGETVQSASTADAETWIHIRGGSVSVVNDTARDADGLDSNGDIVISGGTLRVSLTSSGSNNAIDFGSETGGSCVITGGDVVACGSSMMAEGFSDASTQCSVFYNLGYNAPGGTDVSVLDADGRTILHYAPPCAFSSLYLSSPEMKLGETLTVVIGAAREQITLESVATTAGESSMGGMGWGSMRQNRDGGNTQDRGRREALGEAGDGAESGQPGPMSPGMGGGQDFASIAQGGMPQAPDGSAPPDMGFAPPEFNREMPAFASPTDLRGGQQRPGFGQMQDMREAAEAPAEEAAVSGPQTVSGTTWVMLGACALVLILGILFAVKYRP